jgi:hypothetical protein
VPGGGCVLAEKRGKDLVFFRFDPEHSLGAEVHRIADATAAPLLWDLSPDGKRLAIPSERAPITIHTIATGTEQKRAAPPGCDPIHVTWAADGESLFVTAECAATPLFGVFHVDPHDRVTRLWEPKNLWALEPAASPDGAHLAVSVKAPDNDVWMVAGL